MGVGSEYEYSSVCGIEVNSLQKSHQKRGGDGAGDIGSMGTYVATGSATTSSMGGAGTSITEPTNYTKLSKKIIRRADDLANLSPYNPVVREIMKDFKPTSIPAKM